MTDPSLTPAEELEALITAFPDVGFLIDEDGRYVEVLANPNSEDLLAEPPSALVGRRFEDVFDEATADRFLAAVRTAIDTGESRNFQYDLEVAGEHRTFEANLAPVRDDDEGPGSVIWVARDVTERERYRREIERQERYMRALIDSIDDFFFVLDREATFVDWNSTVNDLTGYSDAELASIDPGDLFTTEDVDRAATLIEEVLGTGRATGEATILTKDGEQIPFEFTGSLFENPRGETLIVGIGRDVTRRKEREQQIRVVERVLRHNVRNEMTVAKGGLDALTGDLPAATQDRIDPIVAALDDLLDVTERTHRVFDELLTAHSRQVFDLGEILREVLEPYRSHASNGDVEIDDAEVRDVEGVPIVATPSIRRAFDELLENAIDHGGTDPTVTISVDCRPNRVVVRVIDDGPGIPPEDATVLTEDPEQTPLFHGSGLGLWLVRWIVTRSRGTVRTHQHEAGSTVVEIELQRHGGPEPTEGQGPANDRAVGDLD